MYVHVYICIYMYRYIYIYIYIYIYQNQIRICKHGIGYVSSNTASRSNHIIICMNAFLHGVLGRSKTASLPYVQPPLTLYTSAICPFFSFPPICVCILLHTYMHAHTRMMTPNTLKMSASVYAYKHTDQTQRTQSKERETKRDKEEV